LNAGRVEILI